MKTKFVLRARQLHKYLTVFTAFILPDLFGVSVHAAENDNNSGKIFADLRLRYESVEQDNALENADALTLRTRLGYETAKTQGFSALIEIENIIEIIDDFSVPQIGIRSGEFSTVADPENTEVDQAYIQYSANGLTAKLGRQVFTLDNHRFVGHVGWRQDRQTYDGLVLEYKPSDKWVVNASYIAQRNRIFGDDADVDSSDVILNTSYNSGYGKLVAYAYLLEVDNDPGNSLDTYGARFKGAEKTGETEFSYTLEYATQKSDNGFDADYLFLEGTASLSGVSAKIGYELLGSDSGQRGFTTPLATLHGLNGWADVFLNTPDAGLEDIYIGLSGKLLGGNWAAVYHDFSSDDSLVGFRDLGDEIDLRYSRKFGENYWAGIKLASYSAGDSAFNLVDTDKVWFWGRAAF